MTTIKGETERGHLNEVWATNCLKRKSGLYAFMNGNACKSTFEVCFLPGPVLAAGRPNGGQAPYTPGAHRLEEGEQLPRKNADTMLLVL